MIRNSMNQTGSISSIQPAICQLLYRLFENENVWPDIFIKAYVDDSLGERAWVDNSSCKVTILNRNTFKMNIIQELYRFFQRNSSRIR